MLRAKRYAGKNSLASKIELPQRQSTILPAGKKFGTLLPKPVNHQGTYTIWWLTSFSTSFSDEEILVAGAISQNVEFQYTNTSCTYKNYEIDLPAVIGTLKFGPFIEDPKTTSEKKLSKCGSSYGF